MDIDNINIITAGDPVGEVFEFNGRLYRGIFDEYQQHIECLFKSGVIGRLEESKTIPRTRVTEHKFGRYTMVLEHEMVWPVTHPMEWSFNMLKDAAATILRVNKVLEDWDLELKDGHLHNILFDAGRSVFVDIGSIVKRQRKGRWQGYDEFLKNAYYPLALRSQGHDFISESLLFRSIYKSIPHASYIKLMHPILRKLSDRSVERLRRILSKWRLYMRPVLGQATLSKIEQFKYGKGSSEWGEYANESAVALEKALENNRFHRLVDLIKKYQAKTLLDIGGNRGVMSLLACKYGGVARAACMDSDPKAIDLLYSDLKNSSLKVTPIQQDFNYCDHSLPARTRSDIVLALALTHHLILGQHRNIHLLFEKFKKFTKEHLFIEFMPEGRGESNLPEWYTLDWFKHAMSKQFNIVHEEKLGENRILLIGKVN